VKSSKRKELIYEESKIKEEQDKLESLCSLKLYVILHMLIVSILSSISDMKSINTVDSKINNTVPDQLARYNMKPLTTRDQTGKKNFSFSLTSFIIF
jgi:uncharacterized protein YeeX (DUF496 family)